MLYREFELPIATILANPRTEWRRLVRPKGVRVAFRELDVDWSVYNPKDYLFTHVSILTSCATEDNGYRIVAPCDELVNNNGNAWTNDVIQHCFTTFRGAENYHEHLQIPALSKGKVLDSVLRPVEHIGKEGKKAQVFTVDLLVATNRKHKQLVADIEAGKMKTLSMGCVCSHVQCSFCGKIITDDDANCSHLNNHLGEHLEENGKKYIVSELCGAMKDGKYIDDSCFFIEASWVAHPAFKGAVLNHYIETEEMRISRADEKKHATILSSMFDNAFSGKIRVADKYAGMALRIAREELMIERLVEDYLDDDQ